MPTEASVPVTKILANNPVVQLAQIQGLDGVYIHQADVTSIAYTVYDLTNASAVVGTGTLTVASVVYDAMQTDDIWERDTIGYNFKTIIPASRFPNASRRYLLNIAFTLASGYVVNDLSEWHTISLTGA